MMREVMPDNKITNKKYYNSLNKELNKHNVIKQLNEIINKAHTILNRGQLRIVILIKRIIYSWKKLSI